MPSRKRSLGKSTNAVERRLNNCSNPRRSRSSCSRAFWGRMSRAMLDSSFTSPCSLRCTVTVWETGTACPVGSIRAVSPCQVPWAIRGGHRFLQYFARRPVGIVMTHMAQRQRVMAIAMQKTAPEPDCGKPPGRSAGPLPPSRGWLR